MRVVTKGGGSRARGDWVEKGGRKDRTELRVSSLRTSNGIGQNWEVGGITVLCIVLPGGNGLRMGGRRGHAKLGLLGVRVGIEEEKESREDIRLGMGVD